jgi:hypothetical protein
LITHLYVAKLKPGTPDATVAEWLEAIRGLSIEGMSSLRCGVDLALREDNDDVAITADFDDVEAWRRYDQDELHNRIRAEHAKPIVESQQRCQFTRNFHFDVLCDIRNVTLVTFKAGTPEGHAERVSRRLHQVKVKGMQHLDAGPDLGLAPGNASAGVSCDFDDPESYFAYDRDELHNQIRQEDIRPYLESARRVQFEL